MKAGSRLTAGQQHLLLALAGMEPAWTLTGGGALVGFHTTHRETRDLDLFFHGQTSLGDVISEARRRLADAGVSISVLRSSATFAQLDARVADEAIVIDLVADPTPIVEPPTARSIGTATILVETAHQLLVNKLCALLSRSEIRDIVDVKALLEAGGDLLRALADCPNQDAGFSPLTFSWAVQGIPLARLAHSIGWQDAQIVELERFRDDLIARVLSAAHP